MALVDAAGKNPAHTTKVLIGLLSYKGEFHPNMTTSLDNLVRRTHAEGVNIAIRKEFGTLICKSRNALVEKTLEIGATHLLFIDSDMVFDDDGLLRLLAWDRDVVSGLCVLRGEPYVPVVKVRDQYGCWKNKPGVEECRFDSEVDAVGCAFTLIKAEVLRKLKRPWFAMPPMEMNDNYKNLVRHHDAFRTALSKADTISKVQRIMAKFKFEPVDRQGAFMGEDIYFCENVKDAGFEICSDGTLIIGHIGEHVFTIDEYVEYKKQREAQEKAKGLNCKLQGKVLVS